MQRSSFLAWVLLFVLAFIWGSSFILIKKGLLGLTSQEVGSLRIVTASLFLLPFALRRFKKVNSKKIIPVFFVGILGSLIPSFLFAIAQTRLESAITGVLNALVPLFTILIALIIFKQKQRQKVYIGVLIGFIGTAILIMAGEDNTLTNMNSYALLIILATICYALNLNLIKQKLDKVSAVTVTSISLLLVGPFATIHLLGFTDFWFKLMYVEGTRIATFYICILGIFGTAIAFIIFNKILQIRDVLFTSYVTYIIPIFAVFWGVIDGEKLYALQCVGMFAIGLGVYITNTHKKIGSKK